MSIRLTVLALAAIAVANAEMMTMYPNSPTSDPAGNHCQDFTADMSTADAQQWWSVSSTPIFLLVVDLGLCLGQLLRLPSYPRLDKRLRLRS